NVREKLEKQGYGMVVASLGNNENKALFFDNLEKQTVHQDFDVSEERLESARNDLHDLDSNLTTCFQYRNKLAVLKTKLSDAEIEFNHIKAEQPLHQNIKFKFDKKFRRKWHLVKTLKFKELLSSIDLGSKLSTINKLRF